MADENDDDRTDDDAQAGDDDGTQAGGASGGSQEDDDRGGDDDQGSSSADSKALADARREAASYRTKLRAAEAKLQAAEDEKLSEVDRLKKRNSELEATIAENERKEAVRVVEAQVVAAATLEKAIDTDVVWSLIRDDATAEGADVRGLVKALAKAKPHLFRTADGGGGANGASSTDDGGKPREETDDERRDRIYGSAGFGEWLDPKTADKRGGGVTISSPEKVVRT